MEGEIQKIKIQRRVAIATLPAMLVLLVIAHAYINNMPLIPLLYGLFIGLLLNLCIYILFD
jgi:F0F1-type ATP synthase assembly protein I